MLSIVKYKEADVEPFLELCREAFPVHNIFSSTLKEVKDYLKNKDKENAGLGGVFFAYDNKSFVGGGLLNVEENVKDAHIRYTYSHIVGVNDNVKVDITRFFSNKIKQDISQKKLKTAKVEVYLAESETPYKSDLVLYKKEGFKEEGKLSSHYRAKEHVVVLGKEL